MLFVIFVHSLPIRYVSSVKLNREIRLKFQFPISIKISLPDYVSEVGRNEMYSIKADDFSLLKLI